MFFSTKAKIDFTSVIDQGQYQLSTIDVNQTNSFLILNSQIYENSTLEGFKIGKNVSGRISVSLLKINGCNYVNSCSNYLLSLDTLTNFTIIKTWTFNLTDNSTYEIPPYEIQKGMIFLLNQTLTGKVKTIESNFVSDLMIDSQNKLTSVRKSGKTFSKFLIEPIFEQSNDSTILNETFFSFQSQGT